jgi:hypothetical protein
MFCTERKIFVSIGFSLYSAVSYAKYQNIFTFEPSRKRNVEEGYKSKLLQYFSFTFVDISNTFPL